MTIVQYCDKCSKQEDFPMGALVHRWKILLFEYDLCSDCFRNLQAHTAYFFKRKI